MNAYRPDPVAVAEQARLRGRRRWWVLALAVLLLLSLVLPHISIAGQRSDYRSLLPTGYHFLNVQAGDFGRSVELGRLALGINASYLGIALHELGLLLSAATFWSLYPDDINRWIYRMLVVGGWLLALSAVPLVLGRILTAQAGVPASLGLAWVPALISGVGIVVGARRGQSRIDDSWYVTRPELL